MPDKNTIVRVDPVRPDPDIIARAGKILTQGGIVIFPAQFIYGIAANALDPLSVEKVFRIKHRPKDNPILVLIRDKKDLKDLAKKIPAQARILMDTFWPGKLTLVFEAADNISPILTAGTGKIGVRLPAQPVAKALACQVLFPITGTSANLSGAPSSSNISDLPASLVRDADLILDAGPLKGGTASTIVDITQTPARILREGALPSEQIHQTFS